MRLLIDGYNLMHAIGLMPKGKGTGLLHGARETFFARLAERIAFEEIPPSATVVVFDARDVPRDLPATVTTLAGIEARFARDHLDADELLIELIRSATNPRRLVVVSSDHRVQIAADRRQAQPIDSDRWWYDRPRLGASTRSADEKHVEPEREKPEADLDELKRWIDTFGGTPQPPSEAPPRRKS